MTRLKFSWRHWAALAAIGWASAAVPATAQNASGGTAARATHLTAETRAGSALSAASNSAQPAAPNAAMTPTAPAPPAAMTPAKAQATPAAAQRTTYESYQSQGTASEAPPAPANRLMNQYATANRAYIGEPVEPGPMAETVAPGTSCSTCGPSSTCGGKCGCNPCQCFECCGPYFYNNGWYVGAEYLHLRADFSSPGAAVERSTVVNPNNNSSVITDRVIEYDIDYDSTFRVFGGYRWGDCGESIELSYWRVEADGAFTSPPATQSLFFSSFEEAIADVPGEVLRTDFNMDLNVFDADYVKRNPVLHGGPSDCGCGCPPWDWAWSLGVRIADFDRVHNNSVINANSTIVSTGLVNDSFDGAGPRAGFEARRYIGEQGKWSFYGTGHTALLLGDHEVDRSRTAGITTTNHTEHFIRTVPVTELEVGVSRQIGCRTLFTAGYEFSAWWDIGRFESIETNNCNCLGSSNIMSFDGFFVRLEHTFGSHCHRRCQ